MSGGGDFDLQAAWLRRFQEDAAGNLGAFARRLQEAMPELVTVQENRSLWSRTARVTGVTVELGEHQFGLELDGKRLRATIRMVVRGVALNTKVVDPAAWFARLAEETRQTTAQARALSQSLRAFAAG